MTLRFAFKAVLLPALVIALSIGLFAAPALAGGGHGGGGSDVTVVNNNGAAVFNGVLTVADTGDNTADGYEGGAGAGGGNTGDANGGYKGGNGGTTGDADGGEGGEGGLGGLIITGGAFAGTSVRNDINRNDTTINSCGCGGRNRGGDVTVVNNNGALVGNLIGTIADTGDNSADGWEGGIGGRGGNTGDANGGAGGGHGHHRSGGGNGGTTGEADGGAGGEGGWGGQVQTGPALAGTEVVNVVNRNITRVRR